MTKERFDPMKAIILSVCMFSVAACALAEGLPPVPSTPAAVAELVYARPFTLSNGYKYDWNKERPTVTSGTLLVLKVNPDLVVPRQLAEPVLYVGNQTAQRLNHGHESGHVIAIVPGEVDLTQTPIWFGSPDLPERVDANMVQTERALADAANIQPFAAEQVQAAAAKGGERLEVSDLYTLLRDHVAELVLQYSPQEKHLAEMWRLPVAK